MITHMTHFHLIFLTFKLRQLTRTNFKINSNSNIVMMNYSVFRVSHQITLQQRAVGTMA